MCPFLFTGLERSWASPITDSIVCSKTGLHPKFARELFRMRKRIELAAGLILVAMMILLRVVRMQMPLPEPLAVLHLAEEGGLPEVPEGLMRPLRLDIE